ncbi:hypothetical protein LDO26_11450 [Luteimonas sp. BDR2-5]|uniref:hypothetical protein n=1 Tax=Proluteimonas luteida TaxID=2878685 RepID=UPI001E439656|nr:hypothetical protein [Luteimonas sp. BDR2-5]MCD9028822.1 hypothetical protein [Luteimonas sp. BDR2-5]
MNVQAFGRWLIVAGALVIAAAVAAVLVLTGSPAAQRDAKLDAMRVRDLARIEQVAGQHLRRDGSLPATLDDLHDGELQRADRVTGAPYGYTVTGPRSLRLCAHFATDSSDVLRAAEPWMRRDWPHGIGEACFERTLATGAQAGE